MTNENKGKSRIGGRRNDNLNLNLNDNRGSND
jgi:hypothetical protein